MKFGLPLWLLGIPLMLGLLIWLFVLAERRARRLLESFVAAHLLQTLTSSLSPVRRRLKRVLFTIAVLLCILAAARPQYGFNWEKTKQKGIDILIAVDTSRSMLAQDVKPNRLMRAKMAVSDLLNRMQGDRVGLIAFSGTSFLQCPLTLDYDSFRQSLEALDTDIIPRGGTDLASAIREAEKAFKLGSQNHKLLILLTDGEDLEASGVAEAREAARHGVKIYTVGVGTSSGELIPLLPGESESGSAGYLKDEKGNVVKSRLDETTLRQIADATGGMYQPLGTRGDGLETIYNEGLGNIPREERESKLNRVFIERFQWPLGLAILILSMELLIGDRRINLSLKKMGSFRKSKQQTIGPGKARSAVNNHVPATLLLLGFLLCFGSASPSQASPQAAERLYEKGDYESAAQTYSKSIGKHPKLHSKLHFNLGAAEYKSGDFVKAVESFRKALETDQPELQELAFYNLGNAQYREGEKNLSQSAEKTRSLWKQALQSYESALQLKPEDEQAKFNYEFVKKKLEEMEKQNPPPQDSSQEQQDQNDNSRSKDPQSKDQQDPSKDGKNDQQQQPQSPPPEEPKQQDSKGNPKENNPDSDNPKDKGGGEGKDEPQENPPADPGKEKPDDQPDQKKQPQPPPPNSAASGKDEPRPGEMSREEAENLLDSLRGEERKMPLVPRGEPENEGPIRDW
jgi:Ca-activated chloride channel homolog